MKYDSKSRMELIKEIEAMHQQIEELQLGVLMSRNDADVNSYRNIISAIVEIVDDVFHEMNQPMQAILGYTELLLINTSTDNPAYEKLTTIKKQTIRMSNLTKKLMKIKNYEFPDNRVSDKSRFNGIGKG